MCSDIPALALVSPPVSGGVSVVVPLYNEEDAVKEFLRELFVFLREHVALYEVIAIDDGSTDATRERLLSICEPSLIPIEHASNRGYGAALKTGIAQARYPWVVIIDGDGSYPVSALASLLEKAGAADMVVGRRICKDAGETALRGSVKALLRMLASHLCRFPIPDLNSGLRLMRKDIVQHFLYLLPDGFSFTTTITLAMLLNNFRVTYVPVSYLKRVGYSKFRPVQDTYISIRLILRTVQRFHPKRILILLALCLAALGSALTLACH